jgi:hypothetical protein
MNRDQIRDVLRCYGFAEGRMISHSKTRYCRRNRGNFVVFNAQLFTARGRVLKQADLDLTLDGQKLTEAARASGQNLYVLYEKDPPPFQTPGDKPISAVLREAVWWTRFRPQDQDRFLPLTADPLWKKEVRLRCATGHWQKQPAFSVDLWGNPGWESLRNYSGAAIQLRGHRPRGFRPAEQAGTFTAEVSTTRGRPVRPVFYQHNGVLDYVWFNHGAAIPAVLYDHTLRLMQGLNFSVHRDNSAIHIRREGKVLGLCWPARITAPEVIQNARAELRRLSTEATQERVSQVSNI